MTQKPLACMQIFHSKQDSNSNQAAWFQQSHSISEEVEETLSYHSETERSIGAINPLELPPCKCN